MAVIDELRRQDRRSLAGVAPCAGTGLWWGLRRVNGAGYRSRCGSLAEHVQRAPLHPLDQFRAFLALREKGRSEEEIAAAFFVAVSVVKQRLRLASVSPRLLDVYAEDEMTLDQLMAFTVNDNHERQEQVFERISLDERPTRFDAEDLARAGAFVSIDGSGSLRVERGFVRPEDEAPIEPELEAESDHDNSQRTVAALVDADDDAVTADPPDTAAESEEDEGLKPLPDRLLTELTAHRTLALRYALGEHPDIAFSAAVHALCLRVFYRYGQDSCLELDLKSASFGAQAPGLADTPLATSFDARHQAWIASMPKEPTELWDALAVFDIYRQRALFAHCVSLSVNAVYES